MTGVMLAAPLGISVTTQSSSSHALWPVLSAPGIRVRFSDAAVATLRWYLVVPVLLVTGGYVMLAGSGPLLDRALFMAASAVLCDLALVTFRGIMPKIPFSRPIQGARHIGLWVILGGGIAWAALMGVMTLLVVFPRMGAMGYGVATLWLLMLRGVTGWWAATRVRKAAFGTELGGEATTR